MQMKNLLRLMGALALTTGAVTSVVACNQQTVVNLDTVLKNKALGTIYVTDITKPTAKELKDAIKKAAGNENINLDGITVTVIAPKVKSDPISSATVTPDGKIYNGDAITVNFKLIIKDIKVTEDIRSALQAGIDGSSLNTKQTQQDAVDIIKTAIKVVIANDEVVGEVVFTFDNPANNLVSGENTINIKVTFGQSKDVAVAAKIINVKNVLEIKNPIGNMEKIEEQLYKSYLKYYESGFEFYKFLLAHGYIKLPTVMLV